MPKKEARSRRPKSSSQPNTDLTDRLTPTDNSAAQSEIAFTAISNYFETGELDPSLDLSRLPINEAVGITLRYMARKKEKGSDAAQILRAESRAALARLNQTDFQMLEMIMTSDAISLDDVGSYLKQRNVKTVPLLSSLPDSVRDYFMKNFDTQLIPTDQYPMTDFGNVVSDSEIPQWYRDHQAKNRLEEMAEQVPIGEFLRDRWFIILTFLLGLITAVGFTLNIGFEAPVLGHLDAFISLYGAVATGRSIVQLWRASETLSQNRGTVRDSYSSAIVELLGETEGFDPEDPEVGKLLKRIRQLSSKSTINWDPYKRQMGFEEQPGEKKIPSVLDEINRIAGAQLSTDDYIHVVTERIKAKEFKGNVPSAAIVIPTYQTSLEEMERLLLSIKNQAYTGTDEPGDTGGLRTAYLVFNDNPNDTNDKKSPKQKRKDGKKLRKKQVQFEEFKELVDRINLTPGRNKCHIELLAQPARGKREAMAGGFANALGSSYLEDLKEEFPEVDPEELKKIIGNFDISELLSFRHDYIINIDSDTEIVDPFAVLNAIILMEHNPDAAATTGDVRVANRDFNLLTEMTYQRYWSAFFKERAAQQDQVTCDSGPFVCMRSSALAKVLAEWYFQEESSGERSTFGDDRHLSTLFLKLGYQSLFCPDSAVKTDSPVDWKTFLKQQLRWNKSFNRENFLVLRFIHQLSKYDQFDIVYQQTFPFAMLYILGNILSKGIGVGLEHGPIAGATVIAPYIFSVLVYNELFFGIYGAIKQQDPNFLLSPVYIDYHFGALLWLKIKAIMDRKNTSWGTKGEVTVAEGLQAIEEARGEIIWEVSQQIIHEVGDENFQEKTHTPVEVPEDAN